MKQRLQKIISSAGILSRRRAEEAIEAGRVIVNGKVCHLGDQADPEVDEITLDGEKISGGEALVYVMLYKPRGVVTTLSDERDRKTVAQLVKDVGCRVYPVGRLDLNSEGLVLLTNDGETANRLMHPRFHVNKTYRVKVRGNLDRLPKLSEPMKIDGYTIKPAEVVVMNRTENEAMLRLTIHEGRNRQIRKMCEMCGLEVRRLQRVSIGEIELDRKLRSGQWRFLTEDEIAYLKQMSDINPEEERTEEAT